MSEASDLSVSSFPASALVWPDSRDELKSPTKPLSHRPAADVVTSETSGPSRTAATACSESVSSHMMERILTASFSLPCNGYSAESCRTTSAAAAPAIVQPAKYFRVKPLIDRLLAAVLLVLATPLMIVVGLAILWSDGYPIFFRQTRVGKNGRTFRIWKFRTMCNNAERSSGAVWSHSADPRVTELGGWLRCTHLDELPQLFNVLTGDMNLIGPRPERPEFVHELALELPFYTQRLTARPGITGLAQLRLDYDQSLAQVHTKVMLDLEYIRSTSLLRDAALLTCTLPHIVNKLRKKCRDSITSQDEQAASRDTASHSTGISPADLARATGRLHVPHLRAHFSNKFASQEIKPGPALRIKPSMTSSADV